jgi:hypothetical protein
LSVSKNISRSQLLVADYLMSSVMIAFRGALADDVPSVLWGAGVPMPDNAADVNMQPMKDRDDMVTGLGRDGNDRSLDWRGGKASIFANIFSASAQSRGYVTRAAIPIIKSMIETFESAQNRCQSDIMQRISWSIALSWSSFDVDILMQAKSLALKPSRGGQIWPNVCDACIYDHHKTRCFSLGLYLDLSVINNRSRMEGGISSLTFSADMAPQVACEIEEKYFLKTLKVVALNSNMLAPLWSGSKFASTKTYLDRILFELQAAVNGLRGRGDVVQDVHWACKTIKILTLTWFLPALRGVFHLPAPSYVTLLHRVYQPPAIAPVHEFPPACSAPSSYNGPLPAYAALIFQTLLSLLLIGNTLVITPLFSLMQSLLPHLSPSMSQAVSPTHSTSPLSSNGSSPNPFAVPTASVIVKWCEYFVQSFVQSFTHTS